jgi:hypothetical protein
MKVALTILLLAGTITHALTAVKNDGHLVRRDRVFCQLVEAQGGPSSACNKVCSAPRVFHVDQVSMQGVLSNARFTRAEYARFATDQALLHILPPVLLAVPSSSSQVENASVHWQAGRDVVAELGRIARLHRAIADSGAWVQGEGLRLHCYPIVDRVSNGHILRSSNNEPNGDCQYDKRCDCAGHNAESARSVLDFGEWNVEVYLRTGAVTTEPRVAGNSLAALRAKTRLTRTSQSASILRQQTNAVNKYSKEIC